MSWLWPIAALLGIVLWAFLCRWLVRNPRGDAITGVVVHALRWYVWRVHRLRVEGAEHIPSIRRDEDGRARVEGPLVVVCNHTAGVDPLLVQAALPFEPRWMMAADMQVEGASGLWRWANVISVERDGRDGKAAVEALRHLRGGGVVGVFPEGGIERPPRHILPFHAGVGILVARSGAGVLPIWIRGTPQTRRAWGSLWRRSRSVIRVGPVMRFGDGARGEEITAQVRAWFLRESGWPEGTKRPRPG